MCLHSMAWLPRSTPPRWRNRSVFAQYGLTAARHTARSWNHSVFAQYALAAAQRTLAAEPNVFRQCRSPAARDTARR